MGNALEQLVATGPQNVNINHPNQQHTRDPVTGVYPFSTEPENTQPTGTSNFSQIDTAQTQVTISTDASKTHVYTVSHSVARFVSGL